MKRGRAGTHITATVVSAVVLVALWALAARAAAIPVVLPAPATVFRSAAALLASRRFLLELGATALRTYVSLGVVVAVAVPLGVAAGRVPVLAAVVAPAASTMRTTPVIAIILLALIWFPSSIVPPFVTLLMTGPIVYEATRSGTRECPEAYLEMARTFGVMPWKRVSGIIVPAAFPSILSGFRTAHGIAWKVCVAAEVLSQPATGIGSRLNEARIYLETDRLIAWIAVLVVVSGLADRALHRLEVRFRRKRGIDE